jgi:hypothetical protein
MVNLPRDILSKILGYLSVSGRLRTARVAKPWNVACMDRAAWRESSYIVSPNPFEMALFADTSTAPWLPLCNELTLGTSEQDRFNPPRSSNRQFNFDIDSPKVYNYDDSDGSGFGIYSRRYQLGFVKTPAYYHRGEGVDIVQEAKRVRASIKLDREIDRLLSNKDGDGYLPVSRHWELLMGMIRDEPERLSQLQTLTIRNGICATPHFFRSLIALPKLHTLVLNTHTLRSWDGSEELKVATEIAFKEFVNSSPSLSALTLKGTFDHSLSALAIDIIQYAHLDIFEIDCKTQTLSSSEERWLAATAQTRIKHLAIVGWIPHLLSRQQAQQKDRPGIAALLAANKVEHLALGCRAPVSRSYVFPTLGNCAGISELLTRTTSLRILDLSRVQGLYSTGEQEALHLLASALSQNRSLQAVTLPWIRSTPERTYVLDQLEEKDGKSYKSARTAVLAALKAHPTIVNTGFYFEAAGSIIEEAARVLDALADSKGPLRCSFMQTAELVGEIMPNGADPTPYEERLHEIGEHAALLLGAVEYYLAVQPAVVLHFKTAWNIQPLYGTDGPYRTERKWVALCERGAVHLDERRQEERDNLVEYVER